MASTVKKNKATVFLSCRTLLKTAEEALHLSREHVADVKVTWDTGSFFLFCASVVSVMCFQIPTNCSMRKT